VRALEFDTTAWFAFILPMFTAGVFALVAGPACKTSERIEKGGGEGATADDTGPIDKNPTTVGGEDASESIDVSGGGFDGDGKVKSGIWRPEQGDFVLRDKETNTVWNLRGEAYGNLDGNDALVGKTLEQVPSFNGFWFAWSVYYDGAIVWQADGQNIRNETGDVEVEDIEMGCPGKDCIPALDYAGREYAGRDRPKKTEMVAPGAPGTDYLDDRELVAGVVVEGEARAFPIDVYVHHEIHNARVGGTEFTMSFCPLTGTAIPFAGTHNGEPIRFGVSGRLLESNLVMFDPGTGTFWSQMLMKGIKGERTGQRLANLPVVETTWERWKEMYPETKVTSSDTGYGRNYNRYVYGDYRTNHDNTFGAAAHQGTYKSKKRVLGLPAADKTQAKLFPFPELEKLDGDRNVINTTFKGEPIAVVWEKEHQMAIPFRRTVEIDGEERKLTFVGEVAE